MNNALIVTESKNKFEIMKEQEESNSFNHANITAENMTTAIIDFNNSTAKYYINKYKRFPSFKQVEDSAIKKLDDTFSNKLERYREGLVVNISSIKSLLFYSSNTIGTFLFANFFTVLMTVLMIAYSFVIAYLLGTPIVETIMNKEGTILLYSIMLLFVSYLLVLYSVLIRFIDASREGVETFVVPELEVTFFAFFYILVVISAGIELLGENRLIYQNLILYFCVSAGVSVHMIRKRILRSLILMQEGYLNYFANSKNKETSGFVLMIINEKKPFLNN